MADLGTMPPAARAVILEIAALRGVDPLKIVNPCRVKKVYRARMEVAERLSQRGYSTTRIGRILNHDHTTIVFYLRGLTGKKPTPRKWRAPRVRTLMLLKRPSRAKPKPPPPRSRLIRYAGFDHTENQIGVHP